MGETLRFAVAGPGFIGAVHARAIQTVPGAELVAVLSRARPVPTAFDKAFPGLTVHTSIDTLARDAAVDAVVIATPNYLHMPLAVPLLEAGKHVLIEKPLARTVEEGERIRAAADASGARVLVGHMWRFDREAQAVRAAVADGTLGQIVKTKGYAVHVNWGPDGWFRDPERAGGGALIDMGVHAIDTVRFLLGDPEPVQVYAQVESRFRDDPVDDTGFLLLRWANDVTSSVECGWWHPHADGVEASTQLFGTAGYARLFPTEIRHQKNGDAVDATPEFPLREEHMDPHIFRAQVAELVAAVREGRPARPGVEHGLVVLRIAEAAYRSARERCAIDLGRPGSGGAAA